MPVGPCPAADSSGGRHRIGRKTRAVVANTGWTKSVPTRSGPKVTVQFQQDRTKIQLEAAQSAQYYGPDILVTEVTACTP